MIEPIIKKSGEKKLIGRRLSMSFANYRVAELWKGFIPRKNEIKNKQNTDFISMAVYKPDHFDKLNPEAEFEKWALVEVTDFSQKPDDMETFILPDGLYAVFNYKGPANDHSFFQYIFTQWLPGSDYLLDDRPHFEVLGDKYKNNDPSSEEEIWIPVKTRN